MLTYQPPKSQVYGHQVGRLLASQIVKLGMRFLEEQCRVTNSPRTELSIGWTPEKHPDVTESVAILDGLLGVAAKLTERPYDGDLVYRHLRWSLSDSSLPTVARSIDSLLEGMPYGDVVITCSTCWSFEWRDGAVDGVAGQSFGGMFGIHLGELQGLTTMFTFRDVSQYGAIKGYLAGIGLVKLSDRYVRPKGSIAGTGPRAR
jgi:hypothetical protein